ncbi:MAG: hypothetical protein MUO31_01380 [Thermodesulfovibrionales bacterium]|nr:hypothetical protein [Thermodesulfovibrionales bacterium]
MPYGDFRGKCYVDFPTSMLEIENVVRDLKIKSDGLTFIGFRFDAGENHPDRKDPPKIGVSLLAVKDDSWKGKFETIGEYIQNEEEIRVIKYSTKLNLVQFFNNYLKRFWGTLVWENLENKTLDITDFEE